MRIETLSIGDNYLYVLIAGARAAVVDPGSAGPVQALLRAEGLTLDLILVTHHHGDHTGGCASLRQVSGCSLAGPAGGSMPLDRTVCDGDVIEFAGSAIDVLGVPGHTDHDVAYHLPAAKAVFTGDALFAAGCGRVFGGDAARMWQSLCRLRGLPDDTRVFGGHDYTLENLEFAAHLEPDHAGVQERLSRCRATGRGDCSPEASTLTEEKETNPFLRCDTEALADAAALHGQDAVAVFAEVRGMKDKW